MLQKSTRKLRITTKLQNIMGVGNYEEATAPIPMGIIPPLGASMSGGFSV